MVTLGVVVGQERRQRQQAALRAQILATALTIAREEGWPGVTMRKIAGRIDYTHAALYAYFATKDDLLLALFRAGSDRLVAALAAAARAADSPKAALYAVADAYCSFAWEQPELYQVLNGLGGVSLAVPETMTEGRRIGAPVDAAIRAYAASEGHDPGNLDQTVALLWSTLHGIVSLSMAGRFARDEAAQLVAQAVGDTLVVWRTRSPPAVGRRVIPD